MIVGRRLHRLAEDKGLNRKTIAYRLGASPSFVCRMLCGKRAFTPKLLDKFIDAIGVQEMRAELHTAAAREYGFKF